MNPLLHDTSVYLELHLVGGLIMLILSQLLKIHLSLYAPSGLNHYLNILLPLVIFFIGRALFEQLYFNGWAIMIALIFGAISVVFSGLLSLR